MPFFQGAVGVNASHSVFNDIGGDQYNYNRTFNGPVNHGDTYNGPIYGSNVGGRGNRTTVYHTHNVDSWGMQHASHYADKEAVLASRLRDIQVKLDAARQRERAKREATMAREREAALARERVERLEAEVAARLAELAELDDDDDDDEAENANAG